MTVLLDDLIQEPRVAYFSMEIALRNEIPTYSGGLGVLAGDTMRSAADLELPMIGVTLISRTGYFRQGIIGGSQIENPDVWQPERWCRSLPARVAVSIGGRDVWIGAWLHIVEGHCGGAIPVVLLDTDLADNSPEDREITHHLYGGDEAYRLKQEIVLGIGGVRMLGALGVEVPLDRITTRQPCEAVVCSRPIRRWTPATTSSRMRSPSRCWANSTTAPSCACSPAKTG